MQSRPLPTLTAFGLSRPDGALGAVLEAQGLHGLFRDFLLQCLLPPADDQLTSALELLPVSARQQDLRRALTAIRASVAALQRAGRGPGTDTIETAFTPKVEAAFHAFEESARQIIAQREAGQRDDPAVIRSLCAGLTNQVTPAINTLVARACALATVPLAPQAAETTDPLTGLPTRGALQQLAAGTGDAVLSEGPVAVFKVEIYNMRQINVSYGITAGDMSLCHVAHRLRQFAGWANHVFRPFGEEFILITCDTAESDTLERRAKDLIAALVAPITCGDQRVQLDIRIGISAAPDATAGQLQNLLDNADMAARTAGQAEPGRYAFYTPDMRTRHKQGEALRAQILDGLESDQFVPYFQPQVESRSGKLVGLEALVRWHHPTRGILTPPDFLTMARDIGLLDELDSALTIKIFATMRAWKAAGLTVPRISINLTATRLETPDLVDILLNGVTKAELRPDMIGLEILESAMIESTSLQALTNIRKLTDAGFKIELDDFGTGHAAISNLRNFNVDRIKIDRSFVKNIHLSSELAKITSSMINLAHSLRVDALAEGVETVEERLVITALGADHVQGYGISRSLPAQEVPAWIMNTQNRPKLPDR